MFGLSAATPSGAIPPSAFGQLAIPVAVACLAVALICIKQALAPIGPLVRALAAVATLALAVGIALVLLVVLMAQGH